MAATALTFAREGAEVLCVDHHLDSAQETVNLIAAKGGIAVAFKADVTKNADIKAMVADAMRAGAASISCTTMSASACQAATPSCSTQPTEEAFDRCVSDQFEELCPRRQACDPDHASAAARLDHQHLLDGRDHHLSYVAYKATKSAMIAFTEQLAYQNAQYGIRANVILPGLMLNTPMAVDTRAREFKKSRAEVEGRAGRKDAAAQDGHRLGRRQCRPVSCIGGSQFHYRRYIAGRRRRRCGAVNPVDLCD